MAGTPHSGDIPPGVYLLHVGVGAASSVSTVPAPPTSLDSVVPGLPFNLVSVGSE